MMSRKHYREMAKILAMYSGDTINKAQLVEDLAEWFSDDNPNFVWSKFRDACYDG